MPSAMALKNAARLKCTPSTCRSTVMTAEEFQRWLMKFDSNGDGQISKEELQTVMRQAGIRFTGWKSRQAVKSADTNRDGYIDEDEIKTMTDFAEKTFGIKIVPY